MPCVFVPIDPKKTRERLHRFASLPPRYASQDGRKCDMYTLEIAVQALFGAWSYLRLDLSGQYPAFDLFHNLDGLLSKCKRENRVR